MWNFAVLLASIHRKVGTSRCLVSLVENCRKNRTARFPQQYTCIFHVYRVDGLLTGFRSTQNSVQSWKTVATVI
jgi:hypothetical protein